MQPVFPKYCSSIRLFGDSLVEQRSETARVSSFATCIRPGQKAMSLSYIQRINRSIIHIAPDREVQEFVIGKMCRDWHFRAKVIPRRPVLSTLQCSDAPWYPPPTPNCTISPAKRVNVVIRCRAYNSSSTSMWSSPERPLEAAESVLGSVASLSIICRETDTMLSSMICWPTSSKCFLGSSLPT